MKSDETKWNKRYTSGKYPVTPHEAVVNYQGLAHKGDALDIAAGNGRNACFLAENGFRVDAVDISSVGLDLIKKRAPSIDIIHADLDTYRIPENSYDLILNINFLDRRLFPQIIAGLKRTGLLIFQTFMDPRLTNAHFDPEKIDRYLSSNELLHTFISLHVLFYEEKKVEFSNGELLKAAILVAKKDLL